MSVYLARLPARDARHPLLRPSRERFRFAGSWSVRLRGAGHHVNHVHSTAWISSAFYVTTPDAIALEGGAGPGWLTFGAPPKSLDLNLEPFRALAPLPGRLVLFPSTLWHGTVPFSEGERLTVAFDVVPVR